MTATVRYCVHTVDGFICLVLLEQVITEDRKTKSRMATVKKRLRTYSLNQFKPGNHQVYHFIFLKQVHNRKYFCSFSSKQMQKDRLFLLTQAKFSDNAEITNLSVKRFIIT